MDPLPTFPPLALNIPTESLPLQPDGHGGYRIGGSRITLDLVIGRFNDGYSPEMLTHSFDTLQLADAYSVIGFYLRHKTDVDIYLKERDRRADIIQQFIEARQPNKEEMKQRLMARWEERQKNHAAAGNG